LLKYTKHYLFKRSKILFFEYEKFFL